MRRPPPTVHTGWRPPLVLGASTRPKFAVVLPRHSSSLPLQASLALPPAAHSHISTHNRHCPFLVLLADVRDALHHALHLLLGHVRENGQGKTARIAVFCLREIFRH